MNRLLGAATLACALFAHRAQGQVIEYDSNGLHYQTLTRSGVTVIYTHMASHIHEYTIIQVAVSNGSGAPYFIRPEDFSYVRPAGPPLQATPARIVIGMLMEKGNGSDVVKLVTTYEA